MAEIKEVFEDIKGTVGDKWYFVLIAVVGFFFIYNLKGNSSSSSTETLTPVTTVSSYPDSVTNANVIISTLQDSIEYSEGVITEKIEALDNNINTNFEATNDYISKGLESVVSIDDKISGLTEKVETVGNIAGATYYETMLHQGRDGYIPYDPERALAVLQNMGFDTSTEKGTNADGTLNNKAGSEGGGWTTFTNEEGISSSDLVSSIRGFINSVISTVRGSIYG